MYSLVLYFCVCADCTITDWKVWFTMKDPTTMRPVQITFAVKLQLAILPVMTTEWKLPGSVGPWKCFRPRLQQSIILAFCIRGAHSEGMFACTLVDMFMVTGSNFNQITRMKGVLLSVTNRMEMPMKSKYIEIYIYIVHLRYIRHTHTHCFREYCASFMLCFDKYRALMAGKNGRLLRGHWRWRQTVTWGRWGKK